MSRWGEMESWSCRLCSDFEQLPEHLSSTLVIASTWARWKKQVEPSSLFECSEACSKTGLGLTFAAF